MSLGFQLASFDRKRRIPSISEKSTQNTPNEFRRSGSGNQDFLKDSTNEVYRMKEYSLISHIESLKAAARGDPTESQEECCKASHDRFSSHYPEDKHSFSPSTKWALDPDNDESNQKIKSGLKQLSCTLEDVCSRGSSCAKESDNCEDDTSSYPRKKSAKGLKKRSGKKKECQSSVHLENDSKLSIPPSVFSNLKKKCDSLHQMPSCDFTVLTALCKRIKIHQKSPSGNVSVKDAPFPKKPSPLVNNIHRKSVSSPAKVSLLSAELEYGKKHSFAPDHRRKISNSGEETSKTKIFLSEKQSGVISDCGKSFPCAPPATPTTDHLRRIEYVPSLQDIRAQRSIRQRLQIIESKALKKEKKKQEDVEKVEKITMREKRLEKKKNQRQEIYALNKLMTDWENERFIQFMSQAGSNM